MPRIATLLYLVPALLVVLRDCVHYKSFVFVTNLYLSLSLYLPLSPSPSPCPSPFVLPVSVSISISVCMLVFAFTVILHKAGCSSQTSRSVCRAACVPQDYQYETSSSMFCWLHWRVHSVSGTFLRIWGYNTGGLCVQGLEALFHQA